MFGSKRQILGYKEKKPKPDEPVPWWGCLPVLIVLGLMALAIWQNYF